MKKAILPLMFSFLTFGALAQNAQRPLPLTKTSAKESMAMFKGQSTTPCVTNSTPTFANKTTATAFYTCTFAGGTTTTLPTGWTSTGSPGGWQWVNSFPSSPTAGSAFTIGPIAAPATVADGWMVYNSDSIGGANGSTTLNSALLSPLINCSTQSTVQLTFYEWFEKFDDSCFVDVTTNGGVSWTTYSNFKNNTIASNIKVPTNPYMVRINITSVAANHNNVQIRFRYAYNGVAGGGYSWHIDDVKLSPLDPVDLGLEGSFAMMSSGDGGSVPIGVSPLQLADTVFPETLLSNLGALTQSAVTVNAQIPTTAFNSNKVIASLPTGYLDSLVDFQVSPAAGYIPSATGIFNIAYNVNQTGDAFAGNNADTASFGITDSTLTGYTPGATISGGYYLHNANLTTPDVRAGFAFFIPVGKHDTLTSFSMAFHPSTHPGAGVVAQIYKHNTDGTWSFIAKSKTKILAASDISTATSGGLVNTTAMVDMSSVTGGIATLDLQSGFYTVLVGTDVAVDTVTIYSAVQTADPNNDGIGFIGRINDGDNAASNNITCDTTNYGGLENIPLVSANFGNNAAVTLGVTNVSFVNAGQVYPNPANTVVNVPFSTNASSNVTVSVTNITGQTLKSQSFSNVTNGTAKFSTTDLSNGLYFFTIEANGSKNTGRFVVAH